MAESAVKTPPSGFRHMISKESEHFQPESGRYHLYIAHACPFAHRAFLTLKLKGLDNHICVSVAHPTFQKTKPGVDDHMGWVFRSETDEPLKSGEGHGSFSCKGCIPDTVNNCKSVRELYEKANGTTERYTIPIIWDKKYNTIVNNESPEIIRILNSAFNDFAKNPSLDLYPEDLRAKIDEMTPWAQRDIVMAVYAAGYADNQPEYDEAVNVLFDALDRLEDILSKNRFVCGNQLTEVDVKIFPTLVRFDEVYHVYFKCNKKRIVDYPNILNYCRDIYQMPGVAETVFMDHCKITCFSSPVPTYSPYAIIPIGPDFLSALKEKHNRDRF